MMDQHDIIKITDCLQTTKDLQCRAIIFFIALFIIVCLMQRKIERERKERKSSHQTFHSNICMSLT